MRKAYCPNCSKLLAEYSINVGPNALFSIKCGCGYEWKSHEHQQETDRTDKYIRLFNANPQKTCPECSMPLEATKDSDGEVRIIIKHKAQCIYAYLNKYDDIQSPQED